MEKLDNAELAHIRASFQNDRVAFDPNSTQALRLKQDSMIENLAAFQGAIKRLERLEIANNLLLSAHSQIKDSLRVAGMIQDIEILNDAERRASEFMNHAA